VKATGAAIIFLIAAFSACAADVTISGDVNTSTNVWSGGNVTTSGSVTVSPVAKLTITAAGTTVFGPNFHVIMPTDQGAGLLVRHDVNHVPSFTKGADQTVTENSGPKTLVGWATNISAGAALEEGQTLTFGVTHDNNALFSVPPAVASNGDLTFTPAANAHGTAIVGVTLHDNGGTLNGGHDTSDPQSFTITVTAANSPPIGTDNTITILEDATYTFASSDFGFSDPNDTPANNFMAVKIKTLPAAGSLELSGVAVSAGEIILVASIPNLTFTPAVDAHDSPYASFTFQVQDDGGTANGGVNLAQTPNTIAFNVTSLNNPPAGMDNTIAMLEEGTYAFVAIDFGFSDPNDTPANNFMAVKITTLPAAGSLMLSGVSVSAGDFIPVAGIPNLTFASGAGGNGSPYTSFTFQVQDDGGTAGGGVDLDLQPRTMTINICKFWTGNGTDNNWTTGANWAGGVAPAEGDSLLFGSTGAVRKSNNNDYSAGTTFRGIRFQDSGYVLTGNAVVFSGGLPINNVAGTNAVDFDVAFNADGRLTCAAGSALNISGAVNISGRTLLLDVAGNLALSGAVLGTGGMIKAGSGTLTLTGTSSYTGMTDVSEGVLVANGFQPNSAVDVRGGAELCGTGSVGTVTISSGQNGIVRPGASVSSGILQTKDVSFGGSSSTLATVINGSVAGADYSQLQVTGAAYLNNCTLSLTLGGTFTPALGDSFTILTSTTGVSGAFSNLPQHSTFTLNGSLLQIVYTETDVKIVCARPLILSDVMPLAGSYVPTLRPTIAATVENPNGDLNFSTLDVRVDGRLVNVTTSTGPFRFTGPAPILSQGPHVVNVTVATTAGMNAEGSWTFFVDTTPPMITNLSPYGGLATNNSRPTYSGTFDGTGSPIALSSIHLYLDGDDVTQLSTLSAAGFNFTPTTPLLDGMRTLTIKVSDAAGNAGQALASAEIDTSPPPMPSITSVTATPDRVVLTLDSPAGVVGVIATADGAQVEGMGAGTFVAAFQKTGGNTFNYSVKFQDAAGNIGPPLIGTETFSSTSTTPPPTLAITTPVISGCTTLVHDGKTFVNSTFLTLSFNVIGGVPPYQAKINQSSVDPQQGSYFIGFPGDGEYAIAIQVTDSAGQGANKSLTIVVDTTGPTINLTRPLKFTTADLQCLFLGPADKEVYWDPSTQDPDTLRNVFGKDDFTPEGELQDASGVAELHARVWGSSSNGNLTFFRDLITTPNYQPVTPDNCYTLNSPDTTIHWALPAPGSLTASLQDYVSNNRAANLWALSQAGQPGDTGKTINELTSTPPDSAAGYKYTYPDSDFPLSSPDSNVSYILALRARDNLGNYGDPVYVTFLVKCSPPVVRAYRSFSPALTVCSDEDTYMMMQGNARMRKEHLQNPIYNSTWRLANPVQFSGTSVQTTVSGIYAEDIAGNTTNNNQSEDLTIWRMPMRVADSWNWNPTTIFPVSPYYNNPSAMMWEYSGHYEDGGSVRWLAGDQLLMWSFDYNATDKLGLSVTTMPTPPTGVRNCYGMRIDYENWPYTMTMQSVTRTGDTAWWDPATGTPGTTTFIDDYDGSVIPGFQWNATLRRSIGPVPALKQHIFSEPSEAPALTLAREDEMCPAAVATPTEPLPLPGRFYNVTIPRADGIPSKAVFDSNGVNNLLLGLKQFKEPNGLPIPDGGDQATDPDFMASDIFLNTDVHHSLGPVFVWHFCDKDEARNDPRTLAGAPPVFTGEEDSISVRMAGVPRFYEDRTDENRWKWMQPGWSPLQYMMTGGTGLPLGEAGWPFENHSDLNLLRVDPSTVVIGKPQEISIIGGGLPDPGQPADVHFINTDTQQDVTASASTYPENAKNKIIVQMAKGAYYNQYLERNGAFGLDGDIAKKVKIRVFIGPDVPAGNYDITVDTTYNPTQCLPAALRLIKCHAVVDANHDGNIDGSDYFCDKTPHGVQIVSGFGIANEPSLSSRVKVKLDVPQDRGVVFLMKDNPHVKIYDQPTGGTEIASTEDAYFGTPGQYWSQYWDITYGNENSPQYVYLDFPADEMITLWVGSYIYCPHTDHYHVPAQTQILWAGATGTDRWIAFVYDSTTIVRQSNGLGADDGISARADVVPGFSSINLMRGNHYFGAVARTYDTPAMGPDVTVSYNHLDGIPTGLGHSWRSNYDVRVFDGSADRNGDGTVKMDERKAGDLLVLIDETGRRFYFEYDTGLSKFKSNAKCGLLNATVDPDAANFDPSGSQGFQYKLVRNDNRTYFFRADGQLVEIRNIRDEKLRISRDSNGFAIAVADDYGRSEALGSESFGGWDGGNLASLSGRQLPNFEFYYDDDWHQRISTTVLSGNFTHGSSVTYDTDYDSDSSKVAQVLMPMSFTRTCTYTPNTKDGSTDVSIAEPFGGTTTVTVNPDADALTVYTEAVNVTDNLTTNYTVDASNRRITEVVKGRYHASMQYDGAGNLTSVAVPGGTTTTYTYSDFGLEGANLLANTGLSGSGSTTFSYYTSGKSAGRVHTVIDPCNASTSYAYDGSGFLASTTDARSKVWPVNSISAFGQPLMVQSPIGRISATTYDPYGHTLGTTDSMNYLASYRYDARGRLVATTQPGGATATTVFDPLDHVISSTDLNGRTTTWTYDAVGRETSYAPSGIAPLQSSYSSIAGGTQVDRTRAGRTIEILELDFIGRTARSGVMRQLGQSGATRCNTSFQYSLAEGWLTSTTDPRGNAWQTVYDDAGRVTQTISPEGAAQKTDYDAAGRVSTSTDPDNNATGYTYDNNGRTLTVTNPAGGAVTNGYDEAGNVKSVTPSLGNGNTFTYDDDGVRATQRDIFGKVHQFTVLDSARQIIEKVDNNPLRTTMKYLDSRGLLKTSITPFGAVTHDVRNDGVQLGFTPPGRGPSGMTLDGLDRVVATSSPAATETVQYDGTQGDLAGGTNALGLVTTNINNPATGDLQQSKDDVSGSLQATATVLQRDENGNVLKFTDAMGREWNQAFDNDNRRVSITGPGPDGITAKVTYSPGSDVVAATRAVGAAEETITHTYNALHQRTSSTDPTGRGATWDHDAFGLPKSATVGSLKTSFTHDPGTRLLVGVTAPGGVSTSYGRDRFGRLTSVTDNEGHQTQYAYNDLDNVTQMTYPDGAKELFNYYGNGDLQWHTDRGGRSTRYSYDPAGRVTTKFFGDIGQSASYGYNGANQVTSETMGDSVGRAFDKRGRLTSVTHGAQAGASFTYHGDNRLDTKTYAGQTLSYNYDPVNGRLLGISAPDGDVTLTYNALGRVDTMNLPLKNLSRTFGYDGAGRQLSMQQTLGSLVEDNAYVYDDAGRLRRHDRLDISTSTQFTYDPAGRLAHERRTGVDGFSNSYNYSGNGNRIAECHTVLIPHALDLSGTALPSEASVLSGSWSVGGGVLTGSGTDAARVGLTLGQDNGLLYTVVLRPDVTQLGVNEETTAGFFFGETLNGRYRLNLVAFKVLEDGVEALKRKLRLEWVAASGTLVFIEETAALAYNGTDLVTISIELIFGNMVASMLGPVAPTLSVNLVHGAAGNVGLEVGGSGAVSAEFSAFTWQSGTAQTQTCAYNALNQLTYSSGTDDTALLYDEVGRMVQSTQNGVTSTYGYDRLDRLTSVMAGGHTNTYGYYGPSWMRQSATVDGVATSYSYDGFACVAQTTGGATTRYMVPGRSPLWETTGPQTKTYASDGRGNVSGLWTGAGYDRVFRYNASGKVTAFDGGGSPVSATSGPRYRGELYDASTDQIYLRNRYLNAGSGSFSSPDPVRQGTNWYAYCGGDPVNRSDPMGTSFDEVIAQFIRDNERKPSAAELADLFNNASQKDIYSDELTPTELELIKRYSVVSYSAADVYGLGKSVFGNSLRRDLADAAYARQWTRHNLMVVLANADPSYAAYTKMFGKTLLAISPPALALSGVIQYTSSDNKFVQAEGVVDATVGLLPLAGQALRYPTVAPIRMTASELETQGIAISRAQRLTMGEILKGVPKNAMMHMTTATEAELASGVDRGSHWVRVGDVENMTVLDYQRTVVGPGAAGYSTGVKGILVVDEQAAATFSPGEEMGVAGVREWQNMNGPVSGNYVRIPQLVPRGGAKNVAPVVEGE
jgi:RHS repeat-associated protein